MERARWMVCGFLLALALTGGTSGARDRLQPIKELTAASGLTGGGTGPKTTVGIATGGVTTSR